jgi:hypothetical protein
MDEGFDSLVAHFTRPPIDITNKTEDLNGKRQAAAPGALGQNARLVDNEQQIKATTPSILEGV